MSTCRACFARVLRGTYLLALASRNSYYLQKRCHASRPRKRPVDLRSRSFARRRRRSFCTATKRLRTSPLVMIDPRKLWLIGYSTSGVSFRCGTFSVRSVLWCDEACELPLPPCRRVERCLGTQARYYLRLSRNPARARVSALMLSLQRVPTAKSRWSF